MPKSGSSFINSALQFALGLPARSITSVGRNDLSSYFGMNSREQEVDELALVQAILASPGGFVTQNHTRGSQYLILQMRFFGLTPILAVRNILDCIVSFDDMMLQWRAGRGDAGWLNDAQFSLPLDYPDLEPDVRYRLLARSYGVWLINFYLSWNRCVRRDMVRPIIVRYEDHILAPDRLLERLAQTIPFTPEQRARFQQYAGKPDPKLSRLNVGVRGRGRERIAAEIVEFLLDYARTFGRELSPQEIGYLIR
jgi:hypothetical protein